MMLNGECELGMRHEACGMECESDLTWVQLQHGDAGLRQSHDSCH